MLVRFLEKSVCLGEVLIPKPAALIGGQWTRMCCRKNTMLFRIHLCTLLLGVSSPQHEHNAWSLALIERIHHSVSKAFPSPSLVRIGLPRHHSENRVEQQHTLIGPLLQTATFRSHKARNIILKLAENIEQGRRREHAFLHRKAHAMCLSRPVVRILSDDHYLGPRECGVIKGGEYLIRWRVHGLLLTLSVNEFGESFPEGLRGGV